MNLIIDVGNTRIKTAVFDDGKMIHNESLTNDFFVSVYDFSTFSK